MLLTKRPIKLQDSCKHGAEAELFLVEGDSAALAVAHLRDAQFQAVLPMQGKPLNAIKATPAKVAENALFNTLVAAMGAGCGEQFDVTQCRYGRIVLLMDPDADGIHCGALMLMYFYHWMRPLLENGMVELARPPVGEVLDTQTGELQYANTEAQFVNLCAEFKRAGHPPIVTQKYRGLAGISQTQLAHSCIDPQTRKTSVMGVKDAQMAMAIFA
jgi:DNA gyrase/topoisomerase IV subunit B